MAKVAGLILAGGLSRRMGGEPKAFMQLDGKTLIQHAVDRLAPQVDVLAINANQNLDRFDALGFPVIEDRVSGFAGPLAGIDAGLAWAKAQGAETLVVAACDAPFFPVSLVARLNAEPSPSGVCIAASIGRTHPVFSAWHVSLATALKAALDQGLRKVDAFEPAAKAKIVEWPLTNDRDPFFNINRPDDLEAAQSG